MKKYTIALWRATCLVPGKPDKMIICENVGWLKACRASIEANRRMANIGAKPVRIYEGVGIWIEHFQASFDVYEYYITYEEVPEK